jgi:hypothetical protein
MVRLLLASTSYLLAPRFLTYLRLTYLRLTYLRLTGLQVTRTIDPIHTFDHSTFDRTHCRRSNDLIVYCSLLRKHPSWFFVVNHLKLVKDVATENSEYAYHCLQIISSLKLSSATCNGRLAALAYELELVAMDIVTQIPCVSRTKLNSCI